MDTFVAFDFTPFFIDISIDKHTMFYTNAGRTVKRFDISSNSQLNDFAALPDSPNSEEPVEATNLRLLHPGDGSSGLLLADYADIKRLDEFGKIIQIYDSSNENLWLALALDPDGKSFWAASGDDVYKFDIESGKELLAFRAGFESLVGGLTVVGEPIAAQPTSTRTPTQTITPTITSHPPTLTRTPQPVPHNTVTPIPCMFPYCIYISTPIALVGIGLLILAAGIIVLALIVRGVRKRSAKRSRPQSAPKRTRTQAHPDAGEQSVVPSE
ncbi:MAG: hypothetical protein Q7J80_04400, partial [Anaerolineales bacterium]|nr:hypothetical protein [Anaerolineales bacterium]